MKEVVAHEHLRLNLGRGFNLSTAKPTGYPILIRITIHPLSTDWAII